MRGVCAENEASKVPLLDNEQARRVKIKVDGRVAKAKTEVLQGDEKQKRLVGIEASLVKIFRYDK